MSSRASSALRASSAQPRDTIDIVAAALAILYVRRVTARQRLRAELREAAASITQ